MAESSWPTVAGSRVVDDVQYEHMAWAWSPADGILGAPGDTTVVFGDSSGRQVKVRSGKRGHVRGRGWYSGTGDNILTIAANTSGSTRTDLVVLRLTRSSTWAVSAAIVQGTPGAGVPSITQVDTGASTGTWEIPLAVVTVANNASTITAGNVVDCTWYSHGNTIVTTSTAQVQPLAISYRYMRHSDTNITYEAAAGAWRRTPWTAAWGLIGGKRYQSGAALASNVTSEVLANINSGSVTLAAGRKYRIHAHYRAYATANDPNVLMRIRETNLAGAIVIQHSHEIHGFGATWDYYFSDVINSPGAGAKTYVLTASANIAIHIYAGASTIPAGVWVEDLGPSSPDVITVV